MTAKALLKSRFEACSQKIEREMLLVGVLDELEE